MNIHAHTGADDGSPTVARVQLSTETPIDPPSGPVKVTRVRRCNGKRFEFREWGYDFRVVNQGRSVGGVEAEPDVRYEIEIEVVKPLDYVMRVGTDKITSHLTASLFAKVNRFYPPTNPPFSLE